MKTSLTLSVALLTAFLSACDERPDKAPVPHTDQPASGLFQDQRNALDKAKQVETTLENKIEENKQAIDQQSR